MVKYDIDYGYKNKEEKILDVGKNEAKRREKNREKIKRIEENEEILSVPGTCLSRETF